MRAKAYTEILVLLERIIDDKLCTAVFSYFNLDAGAWGSPQNAFWISKRYACSTCPTDYSRVSLSESE